MVTAGRRPVLGGGGDAEAELPAAVGPRAVHLRWVGQRAAVVNRCGRQCNHPAQRERVAACALQQTSVSNHAE